VVHFPPSIVRLRRSGLIFLPIIFLPLILKTAVEMALAAAVIDTPLQGGGIGGPLAAAVIDAPLQGGCSHRIAVLQIGLILCVLVDFVLDIGGDMDLGIR